MAAALTQAQGELIGSEITRRLAVFQDAMPASPQAAVEDAKVSVASSMALEKAQLHNASEGMEARIMETIGVAIDERSNVLVERCVAENAATRTTVDELKLVMEAIGRDKFEEMATKMAQLDQSQSHNVALVAGMFGRTSNGLRHRTLSMSAPSRSFTPS